MQIAREGHTRGTPTRMIKLDTVEINWDPEQKAIILTAEGVKDFSGAAKHNYTVAITRRECAMIQKVIADAVLAQYNEGELA